MKKIIGSIMVSVFCLIMGCEGSEAPANKAKSKVVGIKAERAAKGINRSVIDPSGIPATPIDPNDPTTSPFVDNAVECLAFRSLRLDAISKQADGSCMSWNIAEDTNKYIDKDTSINWESANTFNTVDFASLLAQTLGWGVPFDWYQTPIEQPKVFNADYFILSLSTSVSVFGTTPKGTKEFIGIPEFVPGTEQSNNGAYMDMTNTPYADYSYMQGQNGLNGYMIVFTSHVSHNCFAFSSGAMDGINMLYDGNNSEQEISKVMEDIKGLHIGFNYICIIAINPSVINTDKSIPVSIEACNTVVDGITINVNLNNIIKSYEDRLVIGCDINNPQYTRNWSLHPENTQESCNEPLGMSMTISDSILNK